MYTLQLETFIPINKAFGARALCFLANVKMSDEDEYEAQLTGATVLLTHYWSLSTEIQFYLIAPVIVLCAFPQNKKTYSFSLLAFLSLVHYMTTSEAISFNSPIARLWQFLAGFVAAYECLEGTTRTRLSKANCVIHLPIFIVCSIVFIPSPNFFLDTLFRYIVTLSTMWTLMSPGKNPKFLKHAWSVHIGDISFALYLVHWPILCFVKAYAVDDPCLRTWSIPIAFVLSLASADVLHKLFEKRCNIIVILLLIAGCSVLVFVDFEHPKVQLQTDDFFEKAIQLNYQLNIQGRDNHQKSKYAKPFKLERFEKIDTQQKRLTLMEGGTGNLTILIIGNSYARNQGDLIFDGLKSIHNKIYTYYTRQCETLVTTAEYDKQFECVRKPLKTAELLELLKPDLLFIVERGISIKNPLTAEVILEDKYMQQLINNLNTFEQFIRRIFILGPIQPLIIPGPVTKAIEYLKKKQRLRDSPSLVVDDNINQRIRLGKVVEVCRKCIVYEWEYVFYNSTGHFVPFNPDTELLYFDNVLHLGEDGKKKMEPFYANMGREMLWMWKRNLLLM